MNGVQLSRVMYNGKHVWPEPMNVVEVQLSDTVAGDVCAYDGSNKRFFRFVDSGATDNIKNYTPIGVVVVPASHTDDGSARVMSLAVMDYNNPDEGNISKNVSIYYGGVGYDISTLPNLDQAPYIADSVSVLPGSQTLVGFEYISYPNLPSDYYVGTSNSYPNPFDTKTSWGNSSNDSTNLAGPSPYLEDGTKNEIYHSTANTGNVLADMNGKANTEKILAVDNGGSTDWQTASTITNTDITETIHPAVQCCWRFHTTGTTQGDWYLPSGGELGYLAARWKVINASISKVASFGFSALSLSVSNLNSSTESSTDGYITLSFYSDNAHFGNTYKRSLLYTRAFLAVSPLGESGVSPSEASNGVYVYANNGKLYTPGEWDTANNDLAVGVAVVTDDCKFAIGKTGRNNSIVWSNALYGSDVSGILSTIDSTTALTDFVGENNSRLIREASSGEDSSNNAAHWCYAQTITVNSATKHGYLAAAGEWQAAYDNKSAVDSALSKIGGAAMFVARNWSSTKYSSDDAWTIRWSDGKWGGGSTGNAKYACPMYTLD